MMTKKKAQQKQTKTRKKRPVAKTDTTSVMREIVPLNYSAIDREIKRLSDLLAQLKKKSRIVRKSLTYLEKEQRRVYRQINEAKRFVNKLKTRGLKAIRHLPETAEELYYQLKTEFERLSKRLRS